ncbi:MAG: rhomboid family intramembrane serine protease [Nanoarchaeota archaeon]|nr:rhomboid family intramembrane serine protease [Nanoarchaeota archaeon]MBU1004287.1 rhomboid family intramembrane serine protease [Nanoarchaeota archaeon]MBU1946507.1 rhomboid family intramembrane serine protease [Nanoarchaeota archaeon]
MEDIQSESKLVWKLIKDVLLLPFTLILLLFGKKTIGDLFQPIKDLFAFVFEAKVTIILIIINIVMFFGIILLNASGYITDDFISSYFIDTPERLLTLNVIPIIGSWFFHGSLLHLFGNMLFLFIFGRVVEKNIGPLKTLAVYFGAAIVSAIADDLTHTFIIHIENYGSLGASGAIAGLGAAALLLNPFYISWMALGIPLPIIVVVVLQIYTDATGILNPDGISHTAHLGGYASVALMMFILGKENREKMKKGFIICIITIILAFIVYIIVRRYLPALKITI